ncbi:MAG: 50S ribosomal protein L30 [Pigeon pea little leaf phytoplasma]|uniref:50S ribosomal protein L30 n=1 Tax=Candidatus Phytoplasma fabacearum TaxID=2982628 RepID=A0ABU8ZRW4_9MOLU|nr:50S ribosomal protein L30 ['Bituminaria bituminosa' little leaf phytoplasma]MDV3148719.1 50S ribosomal protein L30 [Pigeon pea little leaf phytoplasma]MDO7983409.1 50S ribosomal protein L30 ['Bituminaria bituminosa' little leaf phytoplasma]MDO8023856.1 50S ribosomal protein L30 ['Bituminaria bituminosa' little leaf phytoplasma]MDO8030602.1 50S ribosomal protein L30 ['Bituminaria bituminosa' little leaf phytoplasma]MDV3153922.1 50S ribosomal protein L30 [Pigeon pea little leaf phytoplasma]
MNKIQIKLCKSLIGRTPKQIKTAHALGLKKINQKVIKEEKAVVQGMLNVVKHLISIDKNF